MLYSLVFEWSSRTRSIVLPSLTLVVLLLSLLAYATNASSRECHFPAIYNFGDSKSDTGGLSAAFGQAGSPSGKTFFHQPASRYCGGRLIIDFIVWGYRI